MQIRPMQFRRLSRSATFRLALLYATLFAASVLLLFGFIYWSSVAVIEQQVADTVAAELRGLSEQYREEGISGLVGAVRRRSGPDGDPDSVYLLTDARLRPLAGNLRDWPQNLAPKGEWLRLTLYRTDRGGGPLLVGGRAFSLAGGYRLLVGRDMSARASFRGNLLEALGWGLAVTLALGLGGGLLMSRYLLRRVDAVTATSRAIMAGDLSQRVPVEGRGDEFDRLAASLNQMLSRIEELMVGMRLVTDSLAHDLRSPLTRLKGRIEWTLRNRDDAEGLRDALEQAIGEIDTIENTFNALIAIARAEAGVSRSELAPLDLAELARDVAELYQPAAEEAGLTLSLDCDGEACILGHRQLLSQAIANLLENAMKYGAEGGEVALQVTAEKGSVELSLSDRGPGIPEADRNHVLERFVRLDKSRSRPGSGLGLSLVAAVAKLHGAELSLEDNRPGLKVRWTFAGAPRPEPPQAVA